MTKRTRSSVLTALAAPLLFAVFSAAQSPPTTAKSAVAATEDPAGKAELKAPALMDPVAKLKPNPTPPEYTIGEQDVLHIDVWQERELSEDVVVRPDGKITVPLVDELYVVGMTPPQLEQVLEEKLKPFLTVPKVTVVVRSINSRQVYIVGQVGRRGAIPINSTTTVLQLLAEAGGPSNFAKTKKIYILRNVHGKQVRIPFNYDEVIQGKDDKQNIVLEPGDTVVVP
jgi:polysaccharide biosynthesis/export protein